MRCNQHIRCDKGRSHLESYEAEARATILKLILTACGIMMQHIDFAFHMDQDAKDLHANRWTLQDKTTSIYGTLEQFVLEVVTVPCTRNNFVHLTSFFEALLVICNTSIKHRMVPSTGIKFSTTGRTRPSLHTSIWNQTFDILCV